jgi:hypothetical protein
MRGIRDGAPSKIASAPVVGLLSGNTVGAGPR